MILGRIEKVTLAKTWYNQFFVWLFTRLFTVLNKHDALGIVFPRAPLNLLFFIGGRKDVPIVLRDAFVKEEIHRRFRSLTELVESLVPSYIPHKGKRRIILPRHFLRWISIRRLDHVYVRFAQENPARYACLATMHFKNKRR